MIDYLPSISCRTQLPCLVVLNINMPMLNGKETLAIIKNKERYGDVIVIILTTSRSEKDRAFYERFGVPLYTKPSLYSDYQRIIAELVEFCQLQNAGGNDLN